MVNNLQQLFSIFYASVLIVGLFKDADAKGSGFIFEFMNSSVSTVILFVFLAVGIFLTTLVGKKHSKLQYETYEKNVETNRMFGYFMKFMFDYVVGKDIRIFNMKDLIDKEMNGHWEKIKVMAIEFFKSSLKCEYASITINRLTEYVAYIFIGIKAVLRIITIGELTLYVGALKLLNSSIIQLFSGIISMGIECTYIRNYTTFLGIKNEKYDGTLPVEKRLDNEYELEFRNVSFHYPNSEEMILKNVSLKLKVGNKMAIVGGNGPGKTTFIKLLCRRRPQYSYPTVCQAADSATTSWYLIMGV